jgi:hypothetical protein
MLWNASSTGLLSLDDVRRLSTVPLRKELPRTTFRPSSLHAAVQALPSTGAPF